MHRRVNNGLFHSRHQPPPRPSCRSWTNVKGKWHGRMYTGFYCSTSQTPEIACLTPRARPGPPPKPTLRWRRHTSATLMGRALVLPKLPDSVRFFEFPSEDGISADDYKWRRSIAEGTEVCFSEPLRRRRLQALVMVLVKVRGDMLRAREGRGRPHRQPLVLVHNNPSLPKIGVFSDQHGGGGDGGGGGSRSCTIPPIRCADHYLSLKGEFIELIDSCMDPDPGSDEWCDPIQCVLIPGAPGSGRTTLLQQIRQWFTERLPTGKVLFIPQLSMGISDSTKLGSTRRPELYPPFDRNNTMFYDMLLAAMGADPNIDDFPSLIHQVRKTFYQVTKKEPDMISPRFDASIIAAVRIMLEMAPTDPLLLAIDTTATPPDEAPPQSDCDKRVKKTLLHHSFLHSYVENEEIMGSHHEEIWSIGSGLVMVAAVTGPPICDPDHGDRMCFQLWNPPPPDPLPYIEAARERLGLTPADPDASRRMAEIRAMLWTASYHAQCLADTFADIVAEGGGLTLAAFNARFSAEVGARIEQFIRDSLLAKDFAPHELLSLLVAKSPPYSRKQSHFVQTAHNLNLCFMCEVPMLTTKADSEPEYSQVPYLHPRVCAMFCEAVLNTRPDKFMVEKTQVGGGASDENPVVIGADEIGRFDHERLRDDFFIGFFHCRVRVTVVNIPHLLTLVRCVCAFLERYDDYDCPAGAAAAPCFVSVTASTPPTAKNTAKIDTDVNTDVNTYDDVHVGNNSDTTEPLACTRQVRKYTYATEAFLNEVTLRLLALRVESGCYERLSQLLPNLTTVVKDENGYLCLQRSSSLRSAQSRPVSDCFSFHRMLFPQQQQQQQHDTGDFTDNAIPLKLFLMMTTGEEERKNAAAAKEAAPSQRPQAAADVGPSTHPNAPPPLSAPPAILRAMHARGIISGALHGLAIGKDPTITMCLGIQTIFSTSATDTAEAIATCRRRRATWLAEVAQPQQQQSPPQKEVPEATPVELYLKALRRPIDKGKKKLPAAPAAPKKDDDSHPFTRFVTDHCLVHVYVVAAAPAGGFTAEPFAIGGITCFETFILLDDLHRDQCPMLTTYVYDRLLGRQNKVRPTKKRIGQFFYVRAEIDADDF